MTDGSIDPRDQRRSDRKSPEGIVPVMNGITDERIGHIGNISCEGLMLIARIEPEPGSLFQFSFTLPDPQGNPAQFDVGAVCLWCTKASTPNTFWAGFEIMDIADADAQLLRETVTNL